jgi:uncharacterized protein (TIGR02246 family)
MTEIEALYREILRCWNARDAAGFASCFMSDALVVGFDGSELLGRGDIEQSLSAIFQSHPTASYVAKVRDVRALGANVAVLRAAAGMVPPGERDLNPAVNAIQTLVATKEHGGWKGALFQNTPAAYHGRPELAAQLTQELRASLAGD